MQHFFRAKTLFFFILCQVITLKAVQAQNGPLRVHPKNPRYFTDNTGKAIYLTGSHTWENFQDIRTVGEKPFDYNEYLNMMQQNGHNFMRMWAWEQAKMASWTADSIYFEPLPFARTGPGLAKDGKPKFDLYKYNKVYFDRLRKRVEEAGKRGIYVSVMLFQGWCLDKLDSKFGNPFPYTPFHPNNNVNDISAPETIEDYDDKPSLHSLKIPAVVAVQEAYVRKVIETVNDLDNVLYEILNEGGANDWQYHMIRFIKKTEATMPKQHPVGMTHRASPTQKNHDLFDSPADWVSPNNDVVQWKIGDSTANGTFRENPPDMAGKKVILNDTDHLWGHGGNHRWVWKSFMRGLNPIFMDPWSSLPGRMDEAKAFWIFVGGSGITKDDRNFPDFDLVRKNMGYTRQIATRVDLAAMTPRADLSATGYCLANPGKEYLIYFPEEGAAKVDLRGAAGEYTAEWFIPLLNRTVKGPRPLKGDVQVTIEPPTSLDAVLYLKKK